MIRYAHTNLISRDWQRLARFYETVFACTPVPPPRNQQGAWLSRGTGVPNAALQGVHLRLPGHGEQGPTLEIYQYQEMHPAASPPAANRIGIGHLAFEVSDLAGVLAQVVAAGGKPLGQLSETSVPGVGKIEFIYVTDPDGNIVELQRWTR